MIFLFILFGLPHLHSVLTQTVCVTAYEGETVTLPSSGDSAGNLTRIQWYIFDNRTFIASWRSNSVNLTYPFWSYKGRLSLNTTTGNLQIQNVNHRDAMSYSSLLRDIKNEQYSHSVELRVRAQVPEPSLSKNTSVLHNHRCLVELCCMSPQEGFNISWAHQGSSSVTFGSKRKNIYFLWSILPANSSTNFSCTISDGLRNSSRSILAGCTVTPDEDRKAKLISPGRNYYITVAVLLFCFGLLSGIWFAYQEAMKYKAALF